MRTLAAILLFASLTACAGKDELVLVAPETSSLRDRASSSTVEVVEVSLPTYASSDELAMVAADGSVVTLKNTLWADEPERAMTGALVRNLTAITGAKIAASPWPLSGYPEAELTVRVEQMLVTEASGLLLSGQYAIGREEGAEVVRPFEIAVALEGPGAGNMARAHSAAWRKLAEMIAPSL